MTSADGRSRPSRRLPVPPLPPLSPRFVCPSLDAIVGRTSSRAETAAGGVVDGESCTRRFESGAALSLIPDVVLCEECAISEVWPCVRVERGERSRYHISQWSVRRRLDNARGGSEMRERVENWRAFFSLSASNFL